LIGGAGFDGLSGYRIRITNSSPGSGSSYVIVKAVVTEDEDWNF